MADLRGARVALVLASSTGGVGRHVRSLAVGLTAAGAHVTVLGPAATDHVFGWTAAGAAFEPVEIAPGLRPAAGLRALAVLRRRLAARTDLVHAHGLRAGLLAGLARPAAVPLVLTLHNAVLGGRLRRSLQAPLERAAVRRADLVLAASDDLVARARALGGPDVRLAPVAAPTLPATVRDRADVRAELGALDRPLVLTVARLHPQKGLDTLLAAAEGWAQRRPAPLTVVAGDGPLEAELRAAAGPHVRLLGRRDDIADLLAAADVVALPSRWEARSLVAQEALRAGAPLVAAAVGGIPGLVGAGALLVPPGDPDALFDAVTGLLDDPVAAEALAARGRAQATGWPTEVDTVRQVAAGYAELLGTAV